MNMFRNLWNVVSTIGVSCVVDETERRRIILVNRMSLVMFILFLSVFIIDIFIFREQFIRFGIPFQRLGLTSLSACCGLLFNYLRKAKLAKLSVSLFTFFFLLLYPVLRGEVFTEFYFWFPYAAITFSIIPHMIFSFRKEILSFGICLIFYFLITLFSEELLSSFSSKPLPVQDIINDSILFQKIARVSMFLFINLSLVYFINLARKNELQLETANQNLQLNSEIIVNQAEELRSRNQQLKDQYEEIQTQNEELHESHDELNVHNEELYATLEQLRMMQQQLIQSEKMASIGVLTAGIAHEINNPINFISSGTEALKLVLADLRHIYEAYNQISPETPAKDLARAKKLRNELGYDELIINVGKLASNISTGVERVTEIIRSLRVFSRLDQQELNECNLNEYLEAALVLLHHQYKSHIEVIRKLEELPLVTCNPVQINQVFVNLIINAIDAIDRKGTIIITSRYIKSKDEVEITFKDNGSGIDPEIIDRIFEPFFTTKVVGKGTGLGLAITYGIIENHKGRITVDSKPNEGTEFRICLPRKQEKL
jgi:signal transduction histidine kinase